MMELFEGQLAVIVAFTTGIYITVAMTKRFIPNAGLRIALAMLLSIGASIVLEGAGKINVCGMAPCGSWRWPLAAILGFISVSAASGVHDFIETPIRKKLGGK